MTCWSTEEMGNKMKRIAFILKLILVCIIIFSLTGCGVNQSGYRTLNVKNKLVSFSLEYPAYYVVDGPYVDIKHPRLGTNVDLGPPRKTMKMTVPDFSNRGNLKTVSMSYAPAAIEIGNFIPLPEDGLAHDYIEGWISDINKKGYSESIERTPVTVSGIQTEILSFKSNWGLLIPDHDNPKIKYYRVIYFDYGGYLWSFRAWSEEELVDQIKNDLNHVIETFKIIEVHQP
jgi:hypothetical protein